MAKYATILDLITSQPLTAFQCTSLGGSKKSIPSRFHNLRHRSSRAQNWEIYFLDPSGGLGVTSREWLPGFCTLMHFRILSEMENGFTMTSLGILSLNAAPPVEDSAWCEGLSFNQLCACPRTGIWSMRPCSYSYRILWF